MCLSRGIIKNLTSKIVNTYRSTGLKNLIVKMTKFTFSFSVFRLINDYHWLIKGSRPIFINEVTAYFYTQTLSEANALRYIINNESFILKDILGEIRPNDVFFDIGAHIGVYSCLVDKKITKGSVFAFEPYPPNVLALNKNIELNNSSVHVVEVALSDRQGKISFTKESDSISGNSSIIHKLTTDETLEVNTDKGDSLIASEGIPNPNVVKIDVEGAEPIVIEGLKEALSDKNCRLIYCEIHLPVKGQRPSCEDFGKSFEEIKLTLRDLGFCIEVIDYRYPEVLIKAFKP